MSFSLRVSSYARLYLSMRKYLNRKPRLLTVIRAVRSIWLLGPWQELFVRYHQRFNRNTPLPRQRDSIFNDLDVAATTAELNRNGYALGLQVPEEQINGILSFCQSHQAGNYRNPHLVCETVGQIIHDHKLIEVVSRYLGAEPILYQTSLYWSCPPTDEQRRLLLLSQKSRFHYDVGDFRSLVVFIYLTDVDKDCGPHVVIEATHQKKSVRGLLTRFLNDETAKRKYSGRIKAITGKRGTGFFEDLTCYHKHAVGTKTRLMLAINYVLQRRPPYN
ncbi:MAG: hypothetical protein ABIU20_08225 [Blastocatellia bacterium]